MLLGNACLGDGVGKLRRSSALAAWINYRDGSGTSANSASQEVNDFLEFFATDATLADLESALALARTAAGVQELVWALAAVAWQLRQRDTARSLALAEEAEQHMAAAHLPDVNRPWPATRLQLIRVEALWLVGDHAGAQDLVHGTLQRIDEAGGKGPADALGRADAHWLLGMIAMAQGHIEVAKAELERAALASESIDPTRCCIAQSTLARLALYNDAAAAKARWWDYLPKDLELLHPAAAAVVCEFRSHVAFRSSDYAQAIRCFGSTFSYAMASGQLRCAIAAAINTGMSFGNLNHHSASLEWMQRALDLARSTNSPTMIGTVQVQTAGVLREMELMDAAADMLQEGLALLASEPNTRTYCTGLRYMADVEAARKNFTNALELSRLLEQRAGALAQSDQLALAYRGQASMLLKLGEPEVALKAAQAALEAAGPDVLRQTIALRLIAEIHSKHPLPTPPAMVAPSVPMHYLLMALDLSSHIENYTIPGALLDELAHEYAHAGDMTKAYEFAMRAKQSYETVRSAEACKLAIAMQVKHESEKARVEADKAQAEAERLRQLARTQAERAQVLEQANRTLEHLGNIGLEITGNLDTDAVFAALARHVHALLDAPAFAIFRLDPDGRTLTMVFGVEAGRPLPPCRVDSDDDTSLAARCIRERREFVTQRPSDNAQPIAGTLDTQSVMFAPLVAGDRPLGVMTMQSTRPDAYAEREVAVFRTLCAYGAVALVNADAQSLLMVRNRQLELISTRDSLTDLGNRLHLDQVLAHELQRSRRTHSSLSVIMMDIDHFKSVNDRHGHLAGDQVLVCVARLLLDGTRELDLVGRWGGEEFMVVCRDTGLAGAAVLAEKLRSRIAADPLPVSGRTTASFGVACWRGGESIGDLIARADAAMYTAKQAGRNRVSVASADNCDLSIKCDDQQEAPDVEDRNGRLADSS